MPKGRTGKNIRAAVQIDGLDELLDKLHRLGADVRKEHTDAVVYGAGFIKIEANRMAPAPHIGIEVEKAGREQVSVAVGPTKEKWYYRFFELGAQPHEITGRPLTFEVEEDLVRPWKVHHPGMPARPFLRPAFDRRKDKAIEAVADRLRQRIKALER